MTTIPTSRPSETATAAGSGATRVDVLVVGAGFSGLGALIRLKEAGFEDITVIERGHDVGGTWRDNTYPGAACDVPSHLYSYSFAPNREWTRTFSRQAEIEDYVRSTARKWNAYPHIRFGVELTDAQYDSARGRWAVTTSDGDYDARVLVLGIGALCEPRLPAIEGIESFSGPIFHSSRWDHETPLKGKRVAVIGTGASAIQIVPNIVDDVASLDVYQRTPPWILPRADRAYSRLERLAMRHIPGYAKLVRATQWITRETQVPGLTHHRWASTPLVAAARAHLFATVRDPKLRAKLTPDYQLGCKRILISNGWYPAIASDKVDLVTDPIARVTPTGIVTSDGTEREVDVLINATGFHVTDSPAFRLVHGEDGRSLAEVWETEGMAAYKGTTVAGFPNAFVLIGPATGLGHSSMIYMIESQLNYLVDAMKTMRDKAVDVVSVTPKALQRYNADLREHIKGTVWIAGGCSSWYLDSHGNAPAVWPRHTFRFRQLTKRFDPEAYELRSVDGSGALASAAGAGVTGGAR